MKLAYVITRGDEVGGAQVHVRDLMLGARELGHSCELLTGHPGAFAEDLESRGFRVTRLRHLVRDIDPARELRAVWELRGALKDIAPDVVALHASKAGIIGRLAARGLGTAVVSTVHGWAFGQGVSARRSRLYRGLERAMAGSATRIITVSAYDRAAGLSLGIAPDKLVLVHNGVRDHEARAEPSREPPRIVMVARMAPPKRHDRVLEALGELSDLPWTLELIGDGPQELELRAQVKRLNLESRVEFMGARDDVPTRLAGASVFVLASDHEGFPLSILEAMRAGLPVVADDVGGVAEAVEEGRTGRVLAPRDSEGWREALRELLTNTGLRARWGAAGRAAFEARFDFETQLRATLKVYEDARASL